MKKRAIKWTVFAMQSLEHIQIYLETESGSSSIADRYILRIMERVEQLVNYPDSGQEEPYLSDSGQASRYLLEGNYKIIYQYDEKHIFITDVFHTKQNPRKIIKHHKRK